MLGIALVLADDGAEWYVRFDVRSAIIHIQDREDGECTLSSLSHTLCVTICIPCEVVGVTLVLVWALLCENVRICLQVEVQY